MEKTAKHDETRKEQSNLFLREAALLVNEAKEIQLSTVSSPYCSSS